MNLHRFRNRPFSFFFSFPSLPYTTNPNVRSLSPRRKSSIAAPVVNRSRHRPDQMPPAWPRRRPPSHTELRPRHPTPTSPARPRCPACHPKSVPPLTSSSAAAPTQHWPRHQLSPSVAALMPSPAQSWSTGRI
jgi:hypothetical protein